ncbi:MAG: WYL domain-containing transcriptional regulator [Myxococcales bacterium]|nr:WYL domain-containing transcriptional regulator [Myxococcales bacterium]
MADRTCPRPPTKLLPTPRRAAARPPLLRLLALLQTRRDWSGAELADRLDVDPRTVHRDVDRLRALGYAIDASAGPRFDPRALPGDVAEHIGRAVQVAPYACRARVELSGSAEDNSARVPGWLGVIEAIDDTRCALTVGAPDEATLIGHLVFLGVDFTLLDPPALAPALRAVAARLDAAAARPG